MCTDRLGFFFKSQFFDQPCCSSSLIFFNLLTYVPFRERPQSLIPLPLVRGLSRLYNSFLFRHIFLSLQHKPAEDNLKSSQSNFLIHMAFQHFTKKGT